MRKRVEKGLTLREKRIQSCRKIGESSVGRTPTFIIKDFEKRGPFSERRTGGGEGFHRDGELRAQGGEVEEKMKKKSVVFSPRGEGTGRKKSGKVRKTARIHREEGRLAGRGLCPLGGRGEGTVRAEDQKGVRQDRGTFFVESKEINPQHSMWSVGEGGLGEGGGHLSLLVGKKKRSQGNEKREEVSQ